GVAGRGAHELEGLLVVVTYRARDVIKYPGRVGAVHPLSHPPLEIRHGPVVIRPAVGAALRPPTALDLGKIADSVPHRDLVRDFLRPLESDSVSKGDEDEPLAELRHPGTPSVHHAFLNRVAEVFEFMHHRPEDEHLT